MEIKTRALLTSDVEEILRVQRGAYSANYHESAESFVAKIVASPHTSLGAFVGDTMAAYLIAVSFAHHQGIDLDSSAIAAIPITEATEIYIHDLAVDPQHRGRGLGDLLLGQLESVVSQTSVEMWRLVSVQHSREFWAKRGFEVCDDPVPQGYGPEAILMLRR